MHPFWSICIYPIYSRSLNSRQYSLYPFYSLPHPDNVMICLKHWLKWHLTKQMHPFWSHQFSTVSVLKITKYRNKNMISVSRPEIPCCNQSQLNIIQSSLPYCAAIYFVHPALRVCLTVFLNISFNIHHTFGFCLLSIENAESSVWRKFWI